MQNNKMIQLMMALLRANCCVAIVTAAGYPGNSERFEQRLAGLLEVLAKEQLPPHLCERFYVMVRLCCVCVLRHAKEVHTAVCRQLPSAFLRVKGRRGWGWAGHTRAK
jgi:hypothetical protein